MISTTATIGQKLQVFGYPEGMELDLGGVTHAFSDEEFLDFCARHPDARIERESDGEIIIMPPAFTETGGRNASLSYFVMAWARKDRTGRAFESSTGFTLPNRALRSPDASWVSNKRWNELANEEKAGFSRISPDFVVELRSTTDRLSKIQAKMSEYMANGSSLGWLIDPIERKVHIYRPKQEVEILDDPAEISGEDVMPDFILKLKEIWD